MRYVNTIGLVSLLLLSACGKATIKTAGGTTITLDTSLIATASAEIAVCDTSMTLMATQTGSGAFCIDNVSHGTSVGMQTAIQSCAVAGKTLCSSAQMVKACLAGIVHPNANYYWTSDWGTSTSTGNYFDTGFVGGTCGSTTIAIVNTWTSDYFCCEK